MKTHPKDRRGNEYNKENEADQQAILAAWRGVTLLIKLREEWLLNDETEIVSTSEVTKSERYISFSWDSIQG